MRSILISIFILALNTNAFALDKEIYNSVKKLSAYDSIVINDFSTKDTKYLNFDEGESKELPDLVSDIVNRINTKIVKYVKKNTKFKNIIVNGTAPPTGTVRVEGKIDILNGGIAGMRFSMFAKEDVKVLIRFSGKLIDGETSKEIGEFSGIVDDVPSLLKSAMSKLRTDADEVGEKIADYIEQNYND